MGSDFFNLRVGCVGIGRHHRQAGAALEDIVDIECAFVSKSVLNFRTGDVGAIDELQWRLMVAARTTAGASYPKRATKRSGSPWRLPGAGWWYCGSGEAVLPVSGCVVLASADHAGVAWSALGVDVGLWGG